MRQRNKEIAKYNSKLTKTGREHLNSLKRFLKADTQSEAITLAHIRIVGGTDLVQEDGR